MTIQKECERIEECLDLSTKGKLVHILQAELIATHSERLLSSPDLPSLLTETRSEDLRRLFDLLKRVSLHPQLVTAWSLHLTSTGASILSSSSAKPFKLLVEDLLSLKSS